MRCPKCQFGNRDEAKFCGECGDKLETICPECGTTNRLANKFCDECGLNLHPDKEASTAVTGECIQDAPPAQGVPGADTPCLDGERKFVTVLFSDLSGYTALSEKLDPEEVKEITSRIFGEVSKIIGRFGGFIEKYAGDAVMAIFGVPKAHEDDPIRAVKAAQEIHALVDAISPDVEGRIGQAISMHTGINTGLVVTGEVDVERGTHGVAGDTINVASRLSGLAEAGRILVDEHTFHQAEGYFTFEPLPPAAIKGRAESVSVYRFLTPREKPVTVRRLSGVRADLVGRKVELAELNDAVNRLHKGEASIYTICGDAGTGKSRLVEEFKAGLDLGEIQWLEGHAYAYTQNVPYFPLIDLLSRAFHINEDDSPGKIRAKIETGVEDLTGKKDSVVAYVGSLFSQNYSEAETVSPEYWKSRLHESMMVILTALAKRAPTVIFFEDLHWSDPSFVDLVRHACLEIRQPAMTLCVYRPSFNLFTGHQAASITGAYHEINLKDLSMSDAQDMLESLLKTEFIPADLKHYIQTKTEGNPFFLEELVNSLIESRTLVKEDGSWKLEKSIRDADISSSIHGLISGRLDRLEKETKRILQEASVIGRAFFYEILKKITALKDQIDSKLKVLERLDLIKTRAIQPDLEYMFKHAVTQEVVYNGLLKKERKEIHEKIALIMENLFQNRLPEFYEILAFHFKRSNSILKAVDYLMKSGEKSVKRYAVEESHQYYKEAYELLAGALEKTEDADALLVDLLVKWAYVFYFRGDVNGLIELFSANEHIAAGLEDKSARGMFNGWLGFGHYLAGSAGMSKKYLLKALELGEEAQDPRVIGYACTWLTWNYVDLGRLEEAIGFGQRACEIAGKIPNDPYLYFKPLAGIAYVYWAKGNWKEAVKVGRTILDYGVERSNIRSISMGHVAVGEGYLVAGDIDAAADAFYQAIDVAEDPVYELWAKCWLWITQFFLGDVDNAADTAQEIVEFSSSFGYEAVGLLARGGLGLIAVMNGQMSKGVAILEDAIKRSVENERAGMQALFEHLLGKIYLQLVENKDPVSMSLIAKNIGFLMKSMPFAHKKAEAHLSNVIQIAGQWGFMNTLSTAYLDLGLLHKAKKRTEKARECITEAVKIFEQCEADIPLKKAKDLLATLEQG